MALQFRAAILHCSDGIDEEVPREALGVKMETVRTKC